VFDNDQKEDSMTGYIDPRREVPITVASGAVSESIDIPSAAELQTVNFSFSSVPSSEKIFLRLKNKSGAVLCADSKDASEDNDVEVTLAYKTWVTGNLGGDLEIEFANTDDRLESILVVYILKE